MRDTRVLRDLADSILSLTDDDEYENGPAWVLARTAQLAADEIDRCHEAMRDAMENCEVCRWEDTKERRCARCQTFAKLLGGE